MKPKLNDLIAWPEVQKRLKGMFKHAPSYYSWLRLVEMLEIPYHLDQLSNRKTYDWAVVSEIYSKRHVKVKPKRSS